MITFLPYPNFQQSAQCLDRVRLGNQRNEAWILYQAITIGNKWAKHAAARMWQNHEFWLLKYGIAICEEWRRRGYIDNVLPKFRSEVILYQNPETYIIPSWWGDSILHHSHQSNLLRKDSSWYKHFFPNMPTNIPYYWPR